MVAKALGSARRFLLRVLGLHSLCMCISLQGVFTLLGCESTSRGLIPRAALTAANCVEGFGVGIMRAGRRSTYLAFDDIIKMSGEGMSSWVDVD